MSSSHTASSWETRVNAEGRDEIGVLARVIQQLARRSLFPSRLHGTESGELLLLDLQVAGVSEREGTILAESLRQVVGIEEVLTSRLQRERAA